MYVCSEPALWQYFTYVTPSSGFLTSPRFVFFFRAEGRGVCPLCICYNLNGFLHLNAGWQGMTHAIYHIKCTYFYMQVSFCTLSGGLFLALGERQILFILRLLGCLNPHIYILYIPFLPDLARPGIYVRCQHVRLLFSSWPGPKEAEGWANCYSMFAKCFAPLVSPLKLRHSKSAELCAPKMKTAIRCSYKLAVDG